MGGLVTPGAIGRGTGSPGRPRGRASDILGQGRGPAGSGRRLAAWPRPRPAAAPVNDDYAPEPLEQTETLPRGPDAWRPGHLLSSVAARKRPPWAAPTPRPCEEVVYETRKRIGLMVPSTNTTCEADFQMAVPRGITVHGQ